MVPSYLKVFMINLLNKDKTVKADSPVSDC